MRLWGVPSRVLRVSGRVASVSVQGLCPWVSGSEAECVCESGTRVGNLLVGMPCSLHVPGRSTQVWLCRGRTTDMTQPRASLQQATLLGCHMPQGVSLAQPVT